VYQFKHALIQEIAYQSLLKRTRQQYHRRILHVLEAQFPESGETQPELLAYHASEGVAWEKALVYFRQAASKAMSQSANHEAVAYLEQALTALHQLPARRDTQEHAIDIRVDLRNVLFVLGEPEKILPHLQEAERLAQGLNDHHRLGQVSAYMSSYFWMRGDHDRALTTGHRALAIAQSLKDVTLEAETNLRLGQTYYGLGRYHQALEFLKRNMAAREPLQPHVGEPSGRLAPHILSAFSSTWYVGCLAELGEFAEGMAQAERAVRVAEAMDQPYSHITAYFGLGYLSLLKGDLGHAIPMLERAVEICHVAKIPVWFPAVASYLGTAYALSGRLTEALVLLEQAVTQAPAINARVHSIWLVALGQAYGLVGRLDEAVHTAHRALQLARAYQERGWEAYAFRLLGEISMRREILQVEAYYGQALVLAEELEMRPLLGHCHLGLGTLYSRIGQREQACSELSIAIELYKAMDMTFWPPEAEAALAQVEGR
jgi:tetratricopeptide (TPR) repeat protein